MKSLIAVFLIGAALAVTGCTGRPKCYHCAPCSGEGGKCLPPSARQCDCGPECKCMTQGCDHCVRKANNK